MGKGKRRRDTAKPARKLKRSLAMFRREELMKNTGRGREEKGDSGRK